MQVRGKSVSYIHREFSNKSNAERILKISSHLPKCGIVFTGTPCRISALCKCRNNTKALKRTQTYHKASLLYCSETAGPIELHLETGLALTNAMLLDAGGWGGGRKFQQLGELYVGTTQRRREKWTTVQSVNIIYANCLLNNDFILAECRCQRQDSETI